MMEGTNGLWYPSLEAMEVGWWIQASEQDHSSLRFAQPKRRHWDNPGRGGQTRQDGTRLVGNDLVHWTEERERFGATLPTTREKDLHIPCRKKEKGERVDDGVGEGERPGVSRLAGT